MLVETNGTTDSEMLIETLSLERSLRHFSLPIQISVIDAQRWQKRFWHNALEREQARTASQVFSRAWTWSKNRDSASFVNRSNDTEFVDNPLAWRSSPASWPRFRSGSRLQLSVASKPLRKPLIISMIMTKPRITFPRSKCLCPTMWRKAPSRGCCRISLWK